MSFEITKSGLSYMWARVVSGSLLLGWGLGAIVGQGLWAWGVSPHAPLAAVSRTPESPPVPNKKLPPSPRRT